MCEVLRDRRTLGTSQFPFKYNGTDYPRYDESKYPGTLRALARVLVVPMNEFYTDEHIDSSARPSRKRRECRHDEHEPRTAGSRRRYRAAGGSRRSTCSRNRDLPGAELVAIADTDRESGGRHRRAVSLRGLSRLSRTARQRSVEAVSICTPPVTHAEIMLQAIGRHPRAVREPLTIQLAERERVLLAVQKKHLRADDGLEVSLR